MRHFHEAIQFLPFLFLSAFAAKEDRHEIGDLHGPVAGPEAGDENIRIGHIGGNRIPITHGRNGKPPALLVVKQGAEYAGRINIRQAQPVNRTIQPDQRHRMQITDQAIVIDLLVHFHPLGSLPTNPMSSQSLPKLSAYRTKQIKKACLMNFPESNRSKEN